MIDAVYPTHNVRKRKCDTDEASKKHDLSLVRSRCRGSDSFVLLTPGFVSKGNVSKDNVSNHVVASLRDAKYQRLGKTLLREHQCRNKMARMIFVNLPVTNLKTSMAFYEALGFENKPQFTDDTAASMMWSEAIHVMSLNVGRRK